MGAAVGDLVRNGDEVFFGEHGINARSAELMSNARGSDDLHGFTDRLCIDFDACERAVLWPRRLDVHRDEIDELSFHAIAHDVGIGAIGVEFDRQAGGFASAEEVGEIGMERGLTAGDDDGLNEPFFGAFADFGQHPTSIHRLRSGFGGEQMLVVAPRATKVTALGEDHRSDLARIVTKTEWEVSGDDHLTAISPT